MSRIYVLRDQNVFGFPRVSIPRLNTLHSLEDRIAWHEQTCSRWKPSRVTISGEAAVVKKQSAQIVDAPKPKKGKKKGAAA